MNFINKSNDGYFNYGDPTVWPTQLLQFHAQSMVLEQRVAIAHREQFLERSIGHAAFELWYRAHWEPNRVLMPAPVEISA